MLIASTSWAAHGTINEFGIDSVSTGLDGTGILIGQAEAGRSGKAGYDADTFSASNTIPAGVYFQNDSGDTIPFLL